MRVNRRAAQFLFSVIAVIITAHLFSSAAQSSNDALLKERAFEIDGDFSLTNHNGRPFDLKEQRGKIALLFFGYTSCAEACPVAMAKIASVYKKLAEKRNRLTSLFVSVDPERDTPAALAKYLSYFQTGAIGLTGKKHEIDVVVKQYGARYEIEKSDSALGYHINHSTYLYAIDGSGKVRFRFSHTDAPDLIAEGVSRLIEKGMPHKGAN